MTIYTSARSASVGRISKARRTGTIAASTHTALLYEVEPFDPISFAGGSIVLLVIASTAALLPTIQAGRIEPAVALRND